MLQSTELYELARALDGERVLSVYLDSRVTDPALRHAWRPALASALRRTRDGIVDKRERSAFDRAAAFFHDPVPPPGGAWGAPGWVAFVRPDGPVHSAELPIRTETVAAWRDGPLIAPYLRALKQHRAVIVGIVDGRGARLYRYAYGTLTSLDDVRIEDRSAHGSDSRHARARAIPAPRGALTAGTASKRQRVEFDRVAAAVTEKLALEAGEDAWILIGGTLEIARLTGDGLPQRLTDRAVVSPFLGRSASAEAIVAAAKRAARSLRARADASHVNDVLRYRGHRAAVGTPAVQRALHARAVDLLLLSPRFLSVGGAEADDLVRSAVRQGATVDVLSGEPAHAVDTSAGGVAARLRFPIDDTKGERQTDRPRHGASSPALHRATHVQEV